MRKTYKIISLFAAIIVFFPLNLRSQDLNTPAMPGASNHKSSTPSETINEMINEFKSIENDMAQMGTIYQAMFALLNQAHETNKNKKGEMFLNARGKKRENARDQLITSCLLAVRECSTSISNQGRVSSKFPSKNSLLSYKKNIKTTLSEFVKLKTCIERLTKDHLKYPYTLRQKQKMQDLSRKLGKLKYYLYKSNKDHDDYRNKYR